MTGCTLLWGTVLSESSMSSHTALYVCSSKAILLSCLPRAFDHVLYCKNPTALEQCALPAGMPGSTPDATKHHEDILGALQYVDMSAAASSADTTAQLPPNSATALTVAAKDVLEPRHLLEIDGDLSPISEQGFLSFFDEDLDSAPPYAPTSGVPLSASTHPCTGEWSCACA